jgi:hypothetical protein
MMSLGITLDGPHRRPSQRVWRHRAGLLVVLVVVAWTAGVPEAPAQTAAPTDAEAARVLGDYLVDPLQNRRPLLDLARQSGSVQTAPMQLALADAYLRGGQPGAAAKILTALLDGNPDPQWAAWAELGLGWIWLATGDDARARGYYELAAAGAWRADVGMAMVALLDARDGASGEAADVLNQIAFTPTAAPALRQVARLGAAYAYYWGRDYEAAVSAFTTVRAEFPEGPLADDGRYGAAWSRVRLGDRATALGELRELAQMRSLGERPGRVTDGLVDLEPHAVLRATVRRYRRAPIGNPEQQLVALLDADGGALARAALRRLERSDKADERGTEVADGANDPATAPSGDDRSARSGPGHGVVGESAVDALPVETARISGNHGQAAGRSGPGDDPPRGIWFLVSVIVMLGGLVVYRFGRRIRRAA